MTNISLLIDNHRNYLDLLYQNAFIYEGKNRKLYRSVTLVDGNSVEFEIYTDNPKVYTTYIDMLQYYNDNKLKLRSFNYNFESNLYVFNSYTNKDNIKSGKNHFICTYYIEFYDNIPSIYYPYKNIGIYVNKQYYNNLQLNIVFQHSNSLLQTYELFEVAKNFVAHKSPKEIFDIFKFKYNIHVYYAINDIILEVINLNTSKTFFPEYKVYNNNTWINITDYTYVLENKTLWYCQKIIEYRNKKQKE